MVITLANLKKNFWIFLNENHAKIKNMIKYGTCEKNMHCNQSKEKILYVYVLIINKNNYLI